MHVRDNYITELSTGAMYSECLMPNEKDGDSLRFTTTCGGKRSWSMCVYKWIVVYIEGGNEEKAS